MDALSRIGHRYAGSEGERQMVHAVKERLGDLPGRIEGFVAFTSPATVLGLHAAGLLFAGVLGIQRPFVGAVLSAVFTASLLSEGLGRFSFVRRFASKTPSYNLVVPLRRPDALGTVVVPAPLDSPRWRPDRPRWLRRPLKAVLTSAFVVTTLLVLNAMAEPWGRPTIGMYVTALVVLFGTVVFGWVTQRRRGGVDEDASGPAALLELLRHLAEDAPEHVEVWGVFTGCGHAYQNGMGAFLGMHGKHLTNPVFVLALDDPGRAPVGGVVKEGTLIGHHHRPTGPALVERLRWAGVDIPVVDKAGETDARIALLSGYRALALSGDPSARPDPESALRAMRVADRIIRWFGEDLARVADDAPLLQSLTRRAHVDAVEEDA
ncbi:MAG: hypothetical protein KC656_27520 [Myxococcales bacterium]|nr:hypothetical protein [Myxococcales bacterium]